jgi:hypothetical protein
MSMGQLIKLQDYVSRYEQNIFLYPSRFVRLKRQQWERLKDIWENGDGNNENNQHDFSFLLEDEKQPIIDKIKGIFRKKPKEHDKDHEPMGVDRDNQQEDEGLKFTVSLPFRPASIDELKQQFLDQLFRFQLKWASSTLTEKSIVDHKYFFDEKLKFFLQRFPDTFLVLYHPVFQLKEAAVELETIMLTPTDVWCMTFLEEENHAVFIGSKNRFWVKRYENTEKKMLNPLLALNRTEKIIQKLFHLHDIDLPVHKAVLSRNGYIDYPEAPYDVRLVEKRNFDEWFTMMRKLRSPLKHNQLKAAKILLEYSQTTSMRRMEWEIFDEEQNIE